MSGTLAKIVGFLPDRLTDFTDDMTKAEQEADGGRLIICGSLRILAWHNYADYLKTTHWQSIRERTFRIHGRRCTLGVECEGPLDVHHRTYVNLGDEQPDDTEILCRKHHEMKHTADMARFRGECEMRFGFNEADLQEDKLDRSDREKPENEEE